jgi:hypothetical protein
VAWAPKGVLFPKAGAVEEAAPNGDGFPKAVLAPGLDGCPKAVLAPGFEGCPNAEPPVVLGGCANGEAPVLEDACPKGEVLEVLCAPKAEAPPRALGLPNAVDPPPRLEGCPNAVLPPPPSGDGLPNAEVLLV